MSDVNSWIENGKAVLQLFLQRRRSVLFSIGEFDCLFSICTSMFVNTSRRFRIARSSSLT